MLFFRLLQAHHHDSARPPLRSRMSKVMATLAAFSVPDPETRKRVSVFLLTDAVVGCASWTFLPSSVRDRDEISRCAVSTCFISRAERLGDRENRRLTRVVSARLAVLRSRNEVRLLIMVRALGETGSVSVPAEKEGRFTTCHHRVRYIRSFDLLCLPASLPISCCCLLNRKLIVPSIIIVN